MKTKRGRSAIDQIELMRNLLAFLLVGGFIGVVPALFAFAIPEQNKDIVTYMVGQLSGMALTALSFYFVNKVGQDALDATRSENTGKLADLANTALKTGVEGSGGGANGALNDGERPTGAPGDPVHTTEEET